MSQETTSPQSSSEQADSAAASSARTPSTRTPGRKFLVAILIGLLLAIPIFSIWFLVYDRQEQSETARASIAEGWGGAQEFSGPVLVIPYLQTVTQRIVEDGKSTVKTERVWRELWLAPERADYVTELDPQRRKRSIYEVVVYEAAIRSSAHFALPEDLERRNIAREDLALDRARLEVSLSDARGISAPQPELTAGGQALRLKPSNASRSGGFFAWLDASAIADAPLKTEFKLTIRGNGTIALTPRAGETSWRITSPWPHPSFQGGFLPEERDVSEDGFTATYRIGNLALGQQLAVTGDGGFDTGSRAQVVLIDPVDLYNQVDRSAKYGFLFIGFTFAAFLLFDIVGGVRVSTIEYLLVGSGLVLFFVLLLALAEIIGFALAYLAASLAIVGLNTAYSAAVLVSWRRAAFIGGLLTALYTVLYVLLSLEAFSLLIGALLLLAALATVMYLTRRVDWSARG